MAVMTQYQPVIGMEVHAELLTESKMFCGCNTQFGASPNTQCCPVCVGLPGSLPVPNRAAIEHVLRTALALSCTINRDSIFHRKNYFYPDLPKAFQISQYDVPIGSNGYLDIEVNGQPKRVGIRRVHLEEDTGKLFHVEAGASYIDYNRSGVPLMEIVTEPDIHSADEAREYLVALRQVLVWIGASDGRMEQGSLRCEPNISVRPYGATELGTKAELKNLNSFRVVTSGIDYEIRRHSEALEKGTSLVQETRRWDEERQVTVSMRTKESAHDYRYFPEPDLMPLAFDDGWIEEVQDTIPELPAARRRRFQESYGLGAAEIGVLLDRDTPALADFFEATVRDHGDAKAVSNWLTSDFLRLMNAEGIDANQVKIRPGDLAEMLRLQEKGVISGKIAKSVIEEMFNTGKKPAQIVEEQGLTQIGSADDLGPILNEVLAANPRIVADIQGGNAGKKNFLVGQVMRATRGRANPELVNKLLNEKLGL